MPTSDAVDGFRLAYDDHSGPGDAAAVLLLHGWPGDRRDYRAVVPLLADRCRVVVPDLRGFGDSYSSDDAAAADELFSVLMGEDVEARRSFITRNARDVRFLDV